MISLKLRLSAPYPSNMTIDDLDPSWPLPLDPQTEADLRELAELIIADAVAHCLGDHIDLNGEDDVEVDVMFAGPCDDDCPAMCRGFTCCLARAAAR